MDEQMREVLTDGEIETIRHKTSVEWGNAIGGPPKAALFARAIEQAVIAALSQPAAADGWIQWGGGACPVSDETLVEVKFMDNSYEPAVCADEWVWTHDGGAGDIVAYRIAKAPQ